MKRLWSLLSSGGGQAIGASFVVLLLTIVTGILTARLLSVENRGIAASILAVGAILGQVASSGAAETQILGPRRGHPEGVTVRVTWLFSLSIALPAAVPAFVYTLSLAPTEPSLYVVAGTIPILAMIGVMCNYLLLADRRFGASALLRASPVVIQTVGLLIVWQLDTATLLTIVGCSYVSSVIAGAAALWLSKPWQRRGGAFSQDARPLLRLIFTTGGSHAVRIIGYRLDLILLGLIAGGHEAGLYSVATSLTVAGVALTANLTPLLMTKGGTDSLRFSQLSSLFSFLIAVGIALVGPVLIPIVYGRAYTPEVLLIVVLAAAMYGSFAFESSTRVLQRSGYESRVARVSFAMLVVQATIISFGSHFIGGIGAAMGNLIAYACGLGLLMFATRQDSEMPSLATQLSPLRGARVLLNRLTGR